MPRKIVSILGRNWVEGSNGWKVAREHAKGSGSLLAAARRVGCDEQTARYVAERLAEASPASSPVYQAGQGAPPLPASVRFEDCPRAIRDHGSRERVSPLAGGGRMSITGSSFDRV